MHVEDYGIPPGLATACTARMRLVSRFCNRQIALDPYETSSPNFALQVLNLHCR